MTVDVFSANARTVRVAPADDGGVNLSVLTRAPGWTVSGETAHLTPEQVDALVRALHSVPAAGGRP